MSGLHESNDISLLNLRKGLLGITEDSVSILIKNEPITNNYDVERTPFARGKFAAVRRVTHLSTGVAYAAKFIRKRRWAADQRDAILHEVAVLRLARACPRIVRLIEVYETASEIAIVLELASGGELQRVVDVQEGLGEEQAVRIMRDVLEALHFLHSHNVAHLDLKPQNILLTGAYPDMDIRLCDFGISRVITAGVEVREILGTPDYVAPEILSYEPISLATDVWSAGVLAYVLLSGYSPFCGDTKQQTLCNIAQCALSFPAGIFGGGISARARHFIRSALVTSPRDRMSVEDCLNHPWLSGLETPASWVADDCFAEDGDEDEEQFEEKQCHTGAIALVDRSHCSSYQLVTGIPCYQCDVQCCQQHNHRSVPGSPVVC